MYAISTAFVSILAFVSSLAVVVQAIDKPTTGPRWVCDNTYYATPGETCDAVCAVLKDTFSLSEEDVKKMNPGLDCDPKKKSPLTWCAGMRTPDCLKQEAALYTKCDAGTQLKDWKISILQFVQNNADVDDKCDNLKIGQKYCVSASS